MLGVMVRQPPPDSPDTTPISKKRPLSQERFDVILDNEEYEEEEEENQQEDEDDEDEQRR